MPKDEDTKLISYDQLPKYLQFNPNIVNYYRPVMSAKNTFLSLFTFHNFI